MATVLHGPTDTIVTAIKDALDEYEKQHAGARADMYRQNSGAVRVRVIDERFAGLSRADRHNQLWDFLAARAGQDPMEEVSVLLPLTPNELSDSFANFDFENPLPSEL